MTKPRTPRHFPKMKHRAAKRRGARISIYDADMRMTASTHTRFRPHVQKIPDGWQFTATVRTDEVGDGSGSFHQRILTYVGAPYWIAPVGTPFPEPGTAPADLEAAGWSVLGHGAGVEQ